MTKRLLRAAAALLACGLVSTAFARNDRLMIPIADTLRTRAARTVLAPDIPLRFGSASAQGAEIAGGAAVHGVAQPGGAGNNNNGGRTSGPRPDDVVCQEAFRNALVDLQARARAAGANAVVGIVGNYGGVTMDSPAAFECHIGHTRGVVDLKGQFARGPLPANAVVAPPAAAVAPAQEQGVAAAVPQPPHIATGFAAIDDVDAIPYLGDRGRKQYAEWLKWSTPRAFAISPKGAFYATSGLQPKDPSQPSDPSERALLLCERVAQVPCKLYAVNGAVVWPKQAQ